MFSKKIVAAAALLALAAGAQAQVKLYGQVDMSVGKFKSFNNVQPNGSIKSVTQVESGVMSTGSFIGFSGTEDLGGGLKAGFVLESYLSADTGAANAAGAPFWSRSSHLSLTGGFGKVALGKYDSVLYTMLTNFSPLGDSQVFAPNQVLHYSSPLIIGNAFGNQPFLGQGTSWANAITYETPNLAGFSGTVQYAPKENTNQPANVNNKDSIGLGGAYSAGPLNVSAVYTRTGIAAPFNNALNRSQKTTGLAASYNFGVATLSGIYTKTKVDNLGATPDSSKFYQIGASIPVTAAGKVSVAYGQRKFDLLTFGGQTPKAKQFSLAYEHNLSKRTSVYAAAGNLKASNLPFTPSSIKSTNYAFGIKHNF